MTYPIGEPCEHMQETIDHVLDVEERLPVRLRDVTVECEVCKVECVLDEDTMVVHDPRRVALAHAIWKAVSEVNLGEF